MIGTFGTSLEPGTDAQALARGDFVIVLALWSVARPRFVWVGTVHVLFGLASVRAIFFRGAANMVQI